MNKFNKIGIISLFALHLLSLSGCGQSSNKESFSSWNECASLTSIKEYVEEVTNKNSKQYIPLENRIAVFDMDGTLYGELFPEYLEYLMLEYRVLEDPTYNASDEEKEVGELIKEAGKTYSTPKVSGFELTHAMTAAKAYAGMTIDEFYDYCNEFFKKKVEGFKDLTYKNAFYKPMIEIVNYLKQNDFITYVVSGSDRYLCRALVCDVLEIPASQVIGMDVVLKATGQGEKTGLEYQFTSEDELIRSDELLIKNLKMNKVTAIEKEIGKQPVLSFGNSSGDISMHMYTTTGNPYESKAYMLVADDTLRDHAKIEEANKRQASWEEYGFNIISMKNDFKTIYGDNVECII